MCLFFDKSIYLCLCSYKCIFVETMIKIDGFVCSILIERRVMKCQGIEVQKKPLNQKFENILNLN